jgi:hypothetical protein
MVVGRGDSTSFWDDSWICDSPLKEKFPQLFEICNETKGSVASMARQSWRLSFRRWLNEDLQVQLREMRDMLTSFAVNNDGDTPKWRWESNGSFSVKSTYEHLCVNDHGAHYNLIWKAKLPLKIKIWMWLIEHNAILTKDNLLKRNWSGNMMCTFCSKPESIDHLFFECDTAKYIWSLVAFVLGANHRPTSFGQFWLWTLTLLPQRKQFHMIGLAAFCWAIWKTRNNICFEKKLISSPTEIVCLASSFLNYWAGLQAG